MPHAPPPTATAPAGRAANPTKVGLTGGIGMGKSTVAAMFRELGVAVHDADAAVHRLYGPGGAAVGPVGEAFPGTVVNGAIDRAALSTAVVGNAGAMGRLEAIVHPLVRAEERAFLDAHADAPLVVLDVPLLFETGGDARVDRIVVVSAPDEVRRARVLARPGMTAAKLDALIARQVPDGEKRSRAHHIIDTGVPIEATREQVAALARTLGHAERTE